MPQYDHYGKMQKKIVGNEKTTNINGKKYVRIGVAFIAVLLLSSTLLAFSISNGNTTASAAVPGGLFSTASNKINPATGQIYGDLSQYQWAGSGMTWTQGDNPEMQKYSAGPAPDQYNELWTLNTRADIGTFSAVDRWIGGYVFVRSTKAGVQYINALNPLTGALIYQIRNPSTGAITKYDDTHFFVNVGSNWNVFDTATGANSFNVTNVPSGTNIMYHSKVLFNTESGPANTYYYLVGYNISNPNISPPQIWRIPLMDYHASVLCADDAGDKIFMGSRVTTMFTL